MKLELGSRVTITRRWVSSPKTWIPEGWVARITGTHPKYELRRDFLETNRAAMRGKQKVDIVRHFLSGAGLYEFRNLGDEQALSGFFVVTERRVELISKEAAFEQAARPRSMDKKGAGPGR